MKKQRPILLLLVAIFQILPIVVLPPKTYSSFNALFAIPPLLVFAVIGWALVTWRPAGRTLTIFLQGFNIIVRVLITMARMVPSKAAGTPLDTSLLVSSLVSVALSVIILLYVDQPEMQLLFEA